MDYCYYQHYYVINKINMKSYKFFAILLCTLFLFGCNDSLFVSGGNDDEHKVDDGIILKVYLENSGSMDGFMVNGSEFKDAVYDFISEIGTCGVIDTTELYFINSQLIPFNKEVDDYVLNMNPTSFKNLGGNRQNSDLADVITKVVSNSDDETVSMLISDFIWDVPVGSLDMNSSKIRNAIKNQINAQKDFTVFIMQLKSRFNKVHRPYYIWLFGCRTSLASILKKVQPQNIKHGLKDDNVAVFSPEGEVNWQLASKKQSAEVKLSRDGTYNFSINVSLDNTLQPNDFILSEDSYEFRRGERIELKGIVANTENNKYSHNLKLSVNKNFTTGTYELALKTNGMPEWVKDSNTNNPNDTAKTAGIQNLIQGVCDAYKDVKYVTSVVFVLSKSKSGEKKEHKSNKLEKDD